MNLSTDLIYEELQQHVCVKRAGKADRHLMLHGVYFYREGMQVLNDAVYLIPDGLTAPAETGLAIYFDEGDLPGLHIAPPTQPQDAANLLQALFDRYTQWDQNLHRMVQDGAPIGRILLESAPVIGGALAAVNAHMEPIGAVDYDEDLENPWFSYPLQNVPPEYVQRMRILNDPAGRSRESILHQAAGTENVFTVDLLVAGKCNGRLSMRETVLPLTPARRELLLHLKQYIEQALIHHEYALHTYAAPVAEALDSMLSGIRGYEDQLQTNIMQVFDLQQAPEEYITIVLKPENDMQLIVPEYLMAALQDVLPLSIPFLHGNDLVCLICSPAEKRLKEKLQEILSPMQSISMAIGVSFPFPNLSGFSASCRQAVCAVDTATSMGKKGEVFFFSEYLLTYMLRYGQGDFRAEELMTPGLKRLAAHDAEKEISYLDTLRCCLDHDMNMTAAADALYLHRSSLRQRLSRIYEILGSRLEDPDERLYCRLILRMLQEEKKFIV